MSLSNIPEIKIIDKYIDGSITDNWVEVPQVEKHTPLFQSFRVEQSMGERMAERAEFYADMAREDGTCE